MVDIDWPNLGFKYLPTRAYVEYKYSNDKWSTCEIKTNPYISLHIAASVLHYGQALFEGMKAYRCKDGKVRVFRDEENSKRLNDTANYISCPEIPYEMFQEAIDTAIKENIDYIPPYGSGGSLYKRPFMFGSGPVMGVNPADDYLFFVYVAPVGPYYKGGITPIDAIILDDYDRAAPHGTGCYKVAGNYAASLYSANKAKKMGYPIVLFLDSKTHEYFDEFSTTNFFAITKSGEYLTPKADSILPSITNKSLIQLALDLGIKAERRPIKFEEINTFAEVGACGTAGVVTPIKKIVRGSQTYEFGDICGPVSKKLYDSLTGIQYGELPDHHHWTRIVTG
jgi:branched-chain amino acid aminotransferase